MRKRMIKKEQSCRKPVSDLASRLGNSITTSQVQNVRYRRGRLPFLPRDLGEQPEVHQVPQNPTPKPETQNQCRIKQMPIRAWAAGENSQDEHLVVLLVVAVHGPIGLNRVASVRMQATLKRSQKHGEEYDEQDHEEGPGGFEEVPEVDPEAQLGSIPARASEQGRVNQ